MPSVDFGPTSLNYRIKRASDLHISPARLSVRYATTPKFSSAAAEGVVFENRQFLGEGIGGQGNWCVSKCGGCSRNL